MAAFIITEQKGRAEDIPARGDLFVEGVRYANTAAKFWPTLVDEVQEDFPDCTVIEISASLGEDLARKHLFPELAFERELKRLLTSDIHQVMQDVVAEIEILGPPAAVSVRLLCGEREILSRDLPLDCIDAEILPYVLVWLLEWARIPESCWNDETVGGSITAEDRKRHLVYDVLFTLTSRHLSEGLYRRCLFVRSDVEASREND